MLRSSVLAIVGVAVAWLIHRSSQKKKPMKRIRIVQYNVKRFTQYETVASTLERLRPDIVTLNEVDMSKLPEGSLEPLASRLGLHNAHFYGHVRGSYGNAILCNGGTIDARVELDGGTVVEHKGRQHRIVRGLLVVNGIAGVGAVACTHLDHVDETERAKQARSVVLALQRYKQTLVLAGDLNALRREDYRDEQWAALQARNAANGWMPPADSSAPDGALHIFREAGFVDLALARNIAMPDFTSSSHCPQGGPSNCQRIDYVHVRSPYSQFPLNVVSAFVDGNATGSDHLPVIVDLERTV